MGSSALQNLAKVGAYEPFNIHKRLYVVIGYIGYKRFIHPHAFT